MKSPKYKGRLFMKAVWQRVLEASVEVDGKIYGKIGKGALVFIGIEHGDEEKDLNYIVDKCVNLRLFEDENGKFDRSLLDVNGEILLVSQFTLLGDCRKGRRPSFSKAMPPTDAKIFYNKAVELIKEKGIRCETGIFQAHMKVHLINDGPVTVLLDSRKNF